MVVDKVIGGGVMAGRIKYLLLLYMVELCQNMHFLGAACLRAVGTGVALEVTCQVLLVVASAVAIKLDGFRDDEH